VIEGGECVLGKHPYSTRDTDATDGSLYVWIERGGGRIKSGCRVRLFGQKSGSVRVGNSSGILMGETDIDNVFWGTMPMSFYISSM
jgi:hypothetical protein